MKYRVKQIAENQFLPQVKKGLFWSWGKIREYSIDDIQVYYYISDEQISVKTYSEALKIIENYKEYIKNVKTYPIYYEIK